MPIKAKELTALTVGRLREPGRYAVGGVDGLHLRVVGQSRAWVLRVKIAGRRRDIGLGPYPEVSLAEARDIGMDFRRQVRRGVDPIEERARSRKADRAAVDATTFIRCAEGYIDAHRSGWKSAKHAAQWSATLQTYAFPTFGDRPVSEIDTKAVLAVLRPIWTSKTETASRLRGRIESVLDWARVQGFREGDNPARWRGHLDKLLPARRKVQAVKHHEAFRSTFRDWAGETTAHPREVIEHALAHQLRDKAEAAYQRGDLLSKRKQLMEDWGAYCIGEAAKLELKLDH